MKCERNSELTITFTFDGLDPITFNAEKSKLGTDAMMHGYEQKIRDNAAIARKQKDGTVITVTEQMRRDAVAEMVNHLETSDTWNLKARATKSLNPFIAKLAEKMGKSYAEAEVWYQAKLMEEIGA